MSWITSIDWAAFAVHLASFPELQRIDVVVTRGWKQKAAYMAHVHSHLELLSQERGITLDVREDQGP